MPEKKSSLIDVDDSLIYRWRDLISEISKEKRIFVLSDTETTCNQRKTNNGLFNRVLEWSMIVCTENQDGTLSLLHDEKGKPVFIDQPINFLSISPGLSKLEKSTTRVQPGAFKTHGISTEYLLGESEGGLGRGKLSQEAPNFKTVMAAVKTLFSGMSYASPRECPVISFYNAPFDIGFLDVESELWEVPNIQSYFAVVDLLDLVKKHCGFLKKRSLDDAYTWAKDICPEYGQIERPYHSALVDSSMMLPVYNAVISHLKSQN
tara:strand:- start:90894 stop:91682 length:789 start_codon:yes stop_codon:yes gene_type:complete